MAISLPILHTSGNSKGLQPVFINRLAPKAICLSVDIIAIDRTFIVFSIASGFDIRPYDVRCQRLMLTEILMVIEIERGGVATGR